MDIANSTKKVCVIGAGPSGIISAVRALDYGCDVVLIERKSAIGGVWNIDNGGMYVNAKMQNSKLSYHYSSFKHNSDLDFLGCSEVKDYLEDISKKSKIYEKVKFDSEVVSISKCGGQWKVDCLSNGSISTVYSDLVTVCTGEHWIPKINRNLSDGVFKGSIITSHEYRDAEIARGKRVLVIGGGVSGADIASDISKVALSVDWSVKSLGLFLPNRFGGLLNDEVFSYVGRWMADRMGRQEYLDLLRSIDPDYMGIYEKTGLIPSNFRNNAVHINDYVIRNIYEGLISIKPVVECVGERQVIFQDGRYVEPDLIISCIGYETPKYEYIEGFKHEDLYEHFVFSNDPTLAVISPPVDTIGFGAAFPYFEMIAKWFYKCHMGDCSFPDVRDMREWCKLNMGNLGAKRFYDSWLETIRIGLMAKIIPNPENDFDSYWKIISSVVDAENFIEKKGEFRPGVFDHIFNIDEVRMNLLSQLSSLALNKLKESGSISEEEFKLASMGIGEDSKIPFNLSYPS